MFKLKKKDKVVVITGADKGKKGEVKQVFPAKNKVVVIGVNMLTKHKKPSKDKPGGIHKVEGSIDMSNVKIICPKCDKGVKVKFSKMQTGDKVRVCRKCGELMI
ncbi:MAG: 50S ribosomal protein L24 [Elusimicrobia bacterium]|nr:50S ribosomal protein L24 [Elusimicrobiota bacterium]